jgi:hypothetical protein
MPIAAHRARSRIVRIALAVAVISLLLACGGDSGPSTAPPPPPPPPSLPFVGTYSLQTIADSALPTLVPHPGLAIFVADSGHMILKSDSSYSYATKGIIRPSGALSTAVDTGTFTESGSTITFDSKFLHGILFTAVATDSSLAVAMQGSLLGSTDFTVPVLYKKSP